MVTKPHRDYLAVAEHHRWGDALNKLLPTLRREALDDQDGILAGKWHWRILPHGAMVAFRVISSPNHITDLTSELRIARKEVPTDAEGWRKWDVELRTFLKFFGGADLWEKLPTDEGKCEGVYAAPFRNPDICSRCHTAPVAEPGLFKEDLCTACATELGQQETAEREAKRREEQGAS